MKIYSRELKFNDEHSVLYCPFCKIGIAKDSIDKNDIEESTHYQSLMICCSKCGEKFIKIIPLYYSV